MKRRLVPIILIANSCETTQQADFLILAPEMPTQRQRTGAADCKELHGFGRLPHAFNWSFPEASGIA